MKQRIVTGLVAGVSFLSFLYVGGYAFAGIILCLSVIGMYEWTKMNRFKLREASSMIGMIGVVCFVLPWSMIGFDQQPSFGLLGWFAIFILLALTVITKNKVTVEKAALLIIGMFYIGIGFHSMIAVRSLTDGFFWSLLLFACIWMTDSGAYFTGRILGRHLLWPDISPKKTIEGAIGGILISTVTAVSFALFAPDLLTISKAVWFGAVVSVVAQLGDFIQSAYKRFFNVKDSGTLLPGHGGILDRCDSWLIVFPFAYLVHLI